MTVDHDHLTRMLARLRLTASRDQLDGLLDEAARRALTLREALALLCEREIARKDERRIEMARSVAKFPVVRDLAGFDFAAQPSVDPRQIQCVRVIAAHHPLAGQLVAVVRRTRYQGEPHLVVERPDGGRQLLAARCVEPAAAIPRATAAPAPLVFTPGSLRLLAALVATLEPIPVGLRFPKR